LSNTCGQVQFCVERAIELTLNQLSDSGDDDVLLRDALREMIEVLVDDQVSDPTMRLSCSSVSAQYFISLC
jgi:SUMO ligase MMS21 Smc5/6 complex component